MGERYRQRVVERALSRCSGGSPILPECRGSVRGVDSNTAPVVALFAAFGKTRAAPEVFKDSG